MEGLTKEIIYGQVVSKANSYMAVPDKQGGKRIIKNAKVREYEKSFCKQCKVYRGKYISRPFKLILTVFESSWSFDLDNALKTILDCLQYVRAIKDDNLCIGIDARKAIDRDKPRIEFSIEETEPTLNF